MFVVAVEFSINPTYEQEFRSAVLQQARDSLDREPDCHQFDVCYPAGALTPCFLYEVYENEAAFQTHLESDHFRNFDQRVSGWVAGKLVRQWTRLSPASS